MLDSPPSPTENKQKFQELCQQRILDPGRNVLIPNSMLSSQQIRNYKIHLLCDFQMLAHLYNLVIQFTLKSTFFIEFLSPLDKKNTALNFIARDFQLAYSFLTTIWIVV